MGWRTERTEVLDRITVLEDRLDALAPIEDEDEVEDDLGPVMGATTGSYSEWDELETAVGTLAARRSFSPNFVSDFRTSPAYVDVGKRWSWWSFKINGDYAGFNRGAWDARIVTLLATIPAGHRTTLIMQHEPENDQGIVAADWCAAQARLGNLVRDAGRSELDAAFVLMDWTFNPQSGRNPQDWHSAAMSEAGINVCGIDAYQPYGFLGGKTWHDWETTEARFTGVCQTWGAKIALTEYACPEDPADPMRKANWIADVYAWAVAQKVVALLWFNYPQGLGLTASHLITSSEPARDEFAGQVGQSAA